jgi:hypothetical protein
VVALEAYDYAEQPQVVATVTYDEIRWWAIYLDTFTASDLADAMGVDVSFGEKGVKALLWHGICEDTGEELDGPFGLPERVISYIPLPPGPKEHETKPPEWRSTPGCYELAPVRGMPIRLIDNTERRNQMQGTGGARLRVKQKDRAYERMQEALRKRAEKNRMKERLKHEDPKGKRRRDATLPD